MSARRTALKAWEVPMLLSASTTAGLLAGLLGDGFWDALGWCGVGIPPCIAFYNLLRRPAVGMVRKAVILLFVSLSPGIARAGAEVSFVDPDSFTDAGLQGESRIGAGAPVLRAIREHLERLGRRLPPQQMLRIEILDVDLAGRYEPWRVQAQTVRIMTDTTWPRLRLRYIIEQAGRTIAAGEEEVADPSYLTRSRQAQRSDPLWFERVMLTEWFKRRFDAPPASSGP